MDLVLVTGGDGFIGSHVVKQLLINGFRVRASIFGDLEDTSKYEFLREIEADGDKLELVYGDLTKGNDGEWETIVSGCKYIVHTACPVLIPFMIKDPIKDVYEPSVLGTKYIMEAAVSSSSVKRVIYVGSDLALSHDFLEPKQTVDSWNTKSTIETNAYAYAKVEAEKLALSYNGTDCGVSVVSILPVTTLGRPLNPNYTPVSIEAILGMVRGEAYFNINLGYVDVEDVAVACVRAINETNLSFDRYIISADSPWSVTDVKNALLKQIALLPDQEAIQYNTALINKSKPLPRWLMKFIIYYTPYRLTARSLGRTKAARELYLHWLQGKTYFDAQNTVQDLHMKEFIPVEDAIMKAVTWAIQTGNIHKRPITVR